MVRDREHEGRSALTRVGDVVFGADREVAKWVAAQIPGYVGGANARALGVIKDGQLVAGVIYEHYNGVHVEAAIAAIPKTNWATKQTLFHIFHYPFVTLGCEAITISVASTNLASLNLVTKMGFEPEALVKFAAQDGSTVIIMKMFKNRCKWIRDYGQKRRELRASSPGPERDGPSGSAVQPS